MNPSIIIALLLTVMGAAAGGFKLGSDHEVASLAREQNHIAEAVDAANMVAAQAIASIKPKYTTIQTEVQREILTNTVFADCKLPADSLRLVNQALNGGTVAPDRGKLPKPDNAK